MSTTSAYSLNFKVGATCCARSSTKRQRSIAEYKLRSMVGSEGDAVTSGPGTLLEEGASGIASAAVSGCSKFLKVVAMRAFEMVFVL